MHDLVSKIAGVSHGRHSGLAPVVAGREGRLHALPHHPIVPIFFCEVYMYRMLCRVVDEGAVNGHVETHDARCRLENDGCLLYTSDAADE